MHRIAIPLMYIKYVSIELLPPSVGRVNGRCYPNDDHHHDCCRHSMTRAVVWFFRRDRKFRVRRYSSFVQPVVPPFRGQSRKEDLGLEYLGRYLGTYLHRRLKPIYRNLVNLEGLCYSLTRRGTSVHVRRGRGGSVHEPSI